MAFKKAGFELFFVSAVSTNLSSFTTDLSRELDVLRHDCNSLGMDRAQVGVFEQADQVALTGFLQGHNCCALESQISLEVLSVGWTGTKTSNCAVSKLNNFVTFQAVILACLSNLKKAENEYRQVVSLKKVWKTNHLINFKTVKKSIWWPLKRPGWKLGCEAVLIQQRAVSNQTS